MSIGWVSDEVNRRQWRKKISVTVTIELDADDAVALANIKKCQTTQSGWLNESAPGWELHYGLKFQSLGLCTIEKHPKNQTFYRVNLTDAGEAALDQLIDEVIDEDWIGIKP